MDWGGVLVRMVEVVSQPNKAFWAGLAKGPAPEEHTRRFLLPFALICAVFVCLPYLRHGLIPGILVGLLTAGLLCGLPYAMYRSADAFATGMGGVGYGPQVLYLWGFLQIPVGIGLLLGAITEPFADLQVLSVVGFGYAVYLSTLFLAELYRVPEDRKRVFLGFTGFVWLLLLSTGMSFVHWVTENMWSAA